MKPFPKHSSTSTPTHIAIIMDGNGRWAIQRNLPRIAGHKRGADSVRAIIEACVELKIPYLTLYAFSSENWQRPTEEVEGLMELLGFYLRKEIKVLHKNGVKLTGTTGSDSQLSAAGNFRGTRSATTGLWNGSIDDVRIYNRALSAGEVKQLYLMGK